MSFRERLKIRQRDINSLLCVGLDPLKEKIPRHILYKHVGNVAAAVYEWMAGIVDFTASFACMFKPQVAHYSAILGGEEVLIRLIRHIKRHHSSIPVFLDAKRGDIGRTQLQYGLEVFEKYDADGSNVNPYMGSDCVESWAKWIGRSIAVLCYTSNPKARKIQDKLTPAPDGSLEPLWLSVARDALEWSKEFEVIGNTGLVMAAAHLDSDENVYSEHLSLCREVVSNDLWFLIPGVGKQGGLVKETVDSAYCGAGSITINSSSGISNASSGTNCYKAAAGEAEKLRDEIRKWSGCA